jgi:alkanesulfonate monooxygenase SsuD/methylene tetrahydromethanopterin reductase-like flavin-dependent oxidoreductase (luciferase family)
MSGTEPQTGRGLLLIELDGDGGHPAAWRKSRTSPVAGLGPAKLRDSVLAAESAGFHAATFRDGPLATPDSSADGSADNGSADNGSVISGSAVNGSGVDGSAASGLGRLSALQRAAFVAPLTRSIVLVPEVDTVYTEPFHVSTQLASLDYVSRGRAGWLVAAHGADEYGSSQAAAVGREPVDAGRRTREAGASIEVGRRLWDSWEDDAVIRDAGTGRYLDVDRLHYADFEGPDYSIKGPSIIPRPLQGQLPVLAPAGLLAAEALARGAADALLVSAPTPELLAAELREVGVLLAKDGAARSNTARNNTASNNTAGNNTTGRNPAPALVAELDVVLDARGQAAGTRLAELDAHAAWRSPRARFVGSAAELTELLAGLLTVAAGVRLHPAVLDTDLEELAQLVLPELRRRGLLAPVTPDATFRDLLGLPRPVSRYATAATAVEHSPAVTARN